MKNNTTKDDSINRSFNKKKRFCKYLYHKIYFLLIIFNIFENSHYFYKLNLYL